MTASSPQNAAEIALAKAHACGDVLEHARDIYKGRLQAAFVMLQMAVDPSLSEHLPEREREWLGASYLAANDSAGDHEVVTSGRGVFAPGRMVEVRRHAMRWRAVCESRAASHHAGSLLQRLWTNETLRWQGVIARWSRVLAPIRRAHELAPAGLRTTEKAWNSDHFQRLHHSVAGWQFIVPSIVRLTAHLLLRLLRDMHEASVRPAVGPTRHSCPPMPRWPQATIERRVSAPTRAPGRQLAA